MRAKLIVEGKEFDIDILDPELEKLVKPKKKTGYERVNVDCDYFYEHCEGFVNVVIENNIDSDTRSYACANYYSDKTVAENNSRADKLMRRLRRLAVEHREHQLCWSKEYCDEKWSIVYDCKNTRLISHKNWDIREAFAIYFDSEETANLAIETFHNELIWYFTEYKDSL